MLHLHRNNIIGFYADALYRYNLLVSIQAQCVEHKNQLPKMRDIFPGIVAINDYQTEEILEKYKDANGLGSLEEARKLQEEKK